MRWSDVFVSSRTIDSASQGVLRSETERANRRRLAVFLGAFGVACTVGLAWDFLRPAEYRATARLQITPASYSPPATGPNAVPQDSTRPFLTEVQALSSRSLLEPVAERMRSAGQNLSVLGADPVTGLQSVLTVTPVPGTNVVELAATGPTPELPTSLLVGISDAYREQIKRAFEQESRDVSAGVADEVKSLEAAVAAKRRETEAFRVQNNIVSPEREENAALAKMQGLGKSLKDADARVAIAEGNVRALREAAAAGKSVVRARDNPTLANLEQRASQAREDLRNLERTYTPDYLALDPNARALRARLAEMERQIAAQRKASEQAAFAEAEQELTSAREASRRLQDQIAAGRRDVGQFAARFEQYKALQSDLAQLQSAYQDALQRKARLEATVRARVPSVQVMEQAALPKEAWRPLYWRDAAFVLAGSLALALAAIWIVELFNRPEPHPEVVVAQPVFAGALGHAVHQSLGLASPAVPALASTERPLLEKPIALPRELSPAEVLALLRAADPQARTAIVLLLSGLSPEEALKLRWDDVDRSTGDLRVATARTIRLKPAHVRQLAAGGTDANGLVLHDFAGQPTTLETLSTQLLCAAHDSGLERVQEITPETLRHAYLSFLVRQGIKFSDLTRIVGPLPGATLAAYSAMAPNGTRVAHESVDYVYPALDGLEVERTSSASPTT
jgi:polysaccharide biosynthesis transport protein